MAFSPVITACIQNSCSTLTVTDSTGIYNATTNPTGWQNASTLLAADVATATLVITLPNGIATTYNVLAQIPNPVTGTFNFTDIVLTGYTDGIIEIVYTITNDLGNIYPYTFKGLFTCQTRTCVDKMWAEVACKSCGGSCDLSAAIDDANLAEGLLRGLESGAVCCNEDCINKILTAISQLCNWNNCNC